jgi:hypothetical protein
MVNNCLVSFDKVFEMVMNSTMNVTIPSNFVKPTPKISPTSNNITPAGEDGKQKGGKKRKSGKAGGERITKNVAPISEFLMKDGKNWKQHFARKCYKDCPKWDDTIFMCAHRHIRGECFVDCNNKGSHVGACAIPPAKRKEFKAYIAKVHRENTPSPSA